MKQDNENILDDTARQLINSLKATNEDVQQKIGLNPANHNTATKKYAKLSLSLTNKEKKQIELYRDKLYPGRKKISISSMIMNILEQEGVFEE